jgi:parallel beta-helix repeat protein
VSNSCQTVSKITILAGNYVQDKPINCFGNNFITGAGNSTYIVASQTIGDNSEAFYCNGVSNVTIANMWLDGNPANYFINTFGVLTMYSSGIWVHDCTFSNYNLGTSCGIDVCWTTNSTFENNVCFNIGGAGIWIDIGSSTYVVRNNVVVGNLSGTSNLGIALVFFDDYGNHPGLVTGNTITGNFTWYGLEVYWGSGTTKPYGVTISNNTIHGGNGNRYQSGIWLYRASNCTVENNIIEYNTGSSNNGVLLSDCDHISITNNTLRYNNGAGIYVSTELNQYNTINQNDMRYNVYPTFDNVNLTKDTVVINRGGVCTVWMFLLLSFPRSNIPTL